MKCLKQITSNKKPIAPKPIRKGWTTLDKANDIRLSDVKRMIIYTPNTGKSKQISVSW